MQNPLEHIQEHAQQLRNEHKPCDEQGQLTSTTKDIILNSGGMRLLQPMSHGGLESSPADFYQWVRSVAYHNPSAGWVAGVVGVHPWEVALVDPKLQNEIYGKNPNNWIASPYAPMGKATPEADGFRLSGRWQYSTGTDHCAWVVLGGMVVDHNGKPSNPPEVRHFFLPRSDYDIVQDSWQVMGLSGTGSKDVVVEDAFIPEYRTLLHNALADGEYANRHTNTLYHLPFGCIFSGAIAAATFGIAEGAIQQYRNYLETRVSMSGVVGKSDPFQLEALAEVEADIAAGICHVDHMISQWLEQLSKGNPITKAQRLDFRRNQVRAVQRILFGVDKLFARAGSGSIWTTRTLEHYWRDLRTAGTHISNVSETIYSASSRYSLGDKTATTAMY